MHREKYPAIFANGYVADRLRILEYELKARFIEQRGRGNIRVVFSAAVAHAQCRYGSQADDQYEYQDVSQRKLPLVRRQGSVILQ